MEVILLLPNPQGQLERQCRRVLLASRTGVRVVKYPTACRMVPVRREPEAAKL